MAVKYHITVDQGSEFAVTFDLANTVTDAAANILNYSATSQFRKHYTSNTAYDFVASISNNYVTLSLPAEDSVDIEPGRYMYDVELRHGLSNNVYRIIEGIVTVTPNMTRA